MLRRTFAFGGTLLIAAALVFLTPCPDQRRLPPTMKRKLVFFSVEDTLVCSRQSRGGRGSAPSREASWTVAQLALDLLRRRGELKGTRAAALLGDSISRIRAGLESTLLEELLAGGALKRSRAIVASAVGGSKSRTATYLPFSRSMASSERMPIVWYSGIRPSVDSPGT